MSQAAAFSSASQQFNQALNGFQAGVNGVLAVIPDWAQQIISLAIEKWNELTAQLRDFSLIVQEVLSYGFGDAGALRAKAAELRESVADSLQSISTMFEDNPILSGNTWQGAAGAAFYAGYPDQVSAPTKFMPILETSSDALEDFAAGLDLFWANLTAGLIAAGISIVGLATTTWTIVGGIISAVGLIVSLFFLFKNEIDDLNRLGDVGKGLLEELPTTREISWPSMIAN